ncbi:hypothetical protein HY501_01610 [Candidatus Woesearchaeota archaeon]|nr:hypothetical protein [Candidatus Woesearchaeota archaeon]
MSLVSKIGALLSAGVFAFSGCISREVKTPEGLKVEATTSLAGERLYYLEDKIGFGMGPRTGFRVSYVTLPTDVGTHETLELDVCVWYYAKISGIADFRIADIDCNGAMDSLFYVDKAGDPISDGLWIKKFPPANCILLKNSSAIKDCLRYEAPETTSSFPLAEVIRKDLPKIHKEYRVAEKINAWKAKRGIPLVSITEVVTAEIGGDAYEEKETGFLLAGKGYPRMAFLYAEEDFSDLVARDLKRDACFLLYESEKGEIEFAYRDTHCDGTVDIYYYRDSEKDKLEALRLREETPAICEEFDDPGALETCLAIKFTPADSDAILATYVDNRISFSEKELKVAEKIKVWKARKTIDVSGHVPEKAKRTKRGSMK